MSGYVQTPYTVHTIVCEAMYEHPTQYIPYYKLIYLSADDRQTGYVWYKHPTQYKPYYKLIHFTSNDRQTGYAWYKRWKKSLARNLNNAEQTLLPPKMRRKELPPLPELPPPNRCREEPLLRIAAPTRIAATNSSPRRAAAKNFRCYQNRRHQELPLRIIAATKNQRYQIFAKSHRKISRHQGTPA